MIGEWTDVQEAILKKAITDTTVPLPSTAAEVEEMAQRIHQEFLAAGEKSNLQQLRWSIAQSAKLSRQIREKADRYQALLRRCKEASREIEDWRAVAGIALDKMTDPSALPDEEATAQLVAVEATRRTLARMAEILGRYDQAVHVRNSVPALYRDDPVIGPEFDMPDALVEWMTEFREMYAGMAETRRTLEAWDRALKISERQIEREEAEAFSEVSIVAQGRRCSVRGCSKPAKLDDLCKRHAHERGLMPHGKIGEA